MLDRLKFHNLLVQSRAMNPLLIQKFGLLGAVIAIALPMFLTINWIIPKMALDLLEYSKRTYLFNTFFPAIAIGIILSFLFSIFKMLVPALFWSVPILAVLCFSVLYCFGIMKRTRSVLDNI